MRLGSCLVAVCIRLTSVLYYCGTSQYMSARGDMARVLEPSSYCSTIPFYNTGVIQDYRGSLPHGILRLYSMVTRLRRYNGRDHSIFALFASRGPCVASLSSSPCSRLARSFTADSSIAHMLFTTRGFARTSRCRARVLWRRLWIWTAMILSDSWRNNQIHIPKTYGYSGNIELMDYVTLTDEDKFNWRNTRRVCCKGICVVL